MKRVFLLCGLLGLAVPLLPVFGGCGITTTVDVATDAGLGTGGSVSLDAAGCWQTGKYCDVDGEKTCVDTNDTAFGCGTGACDPCLLPNASAKCGDTECEIGECSPGFKDCDTTGFDHHATGCETKTDKDPTHCGECTTNCFNDTASTDWACDGGKCTPIHCSNANTTECDFDDGVTCETDKTTTDNCGFCTNKCQAANAIDSCTPDSSPYGFGCTFTCKIDFGDCDKLPASGCEKNLSNDKEHCGACDYNCDTALGTAHGTTQCVNSVCQITCDPAWGNCSVGNDGCETPIVTLQNCGACGVPCTPQHATGASCASATCTASGCSSGWDNCNTNWSDGCEQQTNTLQHCGACNTACTAPVGGSADCSSGSCQTQCNQPGYANCDGNPSTCEQLNTSTNCGNCGTPCNPPTNGSASCITGTCVPSCNPPSYKDCDGNPTTCEPLGTNQNCSDCGQTCTGAKTCQGGVCKCPGSQADCGGTCTTILGNDDNNCGGCGVNCTGVATCTNGTCGCATGTYCAGAGCCTGGKTCQAGACACPAGKVDCGGTCYTGTCCSNSDCPENCCEGSGQDHQCHSWGYTC